MSLTDRLEYWNQFPCRDADGHDWKSQVCRKCGLAITAKKRKSHSRKAKKYAQILIWRDGDFCFYCGVELDENTRTVDHVIPLSRGGLNKLDNCVLACKTCNEAKGDQALAVWILGQGLDNETP